MDVGEGGAVVAQLESTVVGGAAPGDENFLEFALDLLEPVDGFLDVVELRFVGFELVFAEILDQHLLGGVAGCAMMGD